MNRWMLGGGAVLLAAIGGAAVALQNDNSAPVSTAAPKAAPSPRETPFAIGKETPMADRVAVIGLLNKRNGISRDLTMKPGQAFRIGDVIVRLRAWRPQRSGKSKS